MKRNLIVALLICLISLIGFGSKRDLFVAKAGGKKITLGHLEEA